MPKNNSKKSFSILLVTRFCVALVNIVLMTLLAIIFLEEPFQFKGTEIAILVGTYGICSSGLEVLHSFYIHILS